MLVQQKIIYHARELILNNDVSEKVKFEKHTYNVCKRIIIDIPLGSSRVGGIEVRG